MLPTVAAPRLGTAGGGGHRSCANHTQANSTNRPKSTPSGRSPRQHHVSVQLEGEAVQLGQVRQVLAHCRDIICGRITQLRRAVGTCTPEQRTVQMDVQPGSRQQPAPPSNPPRSASCERSRSRFSRSRGEPCGGKEKARPKAVALLPTCCRIGLPAGPAAEPSQHSRQPRLPPMPAAAARRVGHVREQLAHLPLLCPTRPDQPRLAGLRSLTWCAMRTHSLRTFSQSQQLARTHMQYWTLCLTWCAMRTHSLFISVKLTSKNSRASTTLPPSAALCGQQHLF